MLTAAKTLLLLSLAALAATGVQQDKDLHGFQPEYSTDAQLKFPEHYREWVYLTSGLDMSYTAAAAGDTNDSHTFDNVFVNPDAYQAFLKTGTWPDKTMLVLENRKGQQKGSINQAGHFQTALGAHDKSSTMIPTTADCYSCHAEHAAVDTTFVQFYPTLLPVAKSKGTLSALYLKEIDTETHVK
jgi:hypothetical protein